MDEPMLRVWMQESVPPLTAYEERPGRWVGEPSWPSPHVHTERRPLARGRIAEPGDTPAEEPVGIESPLTVGQFAGKWCSYNAPPDLPYDQREEDGGSLVFDSDPLEERFEILGAPVLSLDFSANRPNAMVAVRVSDIARDGRATRVTYGLLNLTHRNGHRDPGPLVPGERCQVRVALNGVAHAFAPGHRIRVSLSTSYWPLAWPPPEPVRLEVFTGASSIELPVRPVAEHDEVSPRPFEDPEGCRPMPVTSVEPGRHRWEVTRDLVDYQSRLEVTKDLGVVHFDDIGLDVARSAEETYRSRGADVESVAGETVWRMGFRRDDWDVRTVTRTVLTSTSTDFHLHAELDAYEDGRRVLSRNWQQTIPRDHV
jgi:predicted acyl esterase